MADDWQAVKSQYGTYWWNTKTNQTTQVGSPKPGAIVEINELETTPVTSKQPVIPEKVIAPVASGVLASTKPVESLKPEFTKSESKAPAGMYIVVFKSGTSKSIVDQAVNQVLSQGGTIRHRYDTVFMGFACTIPDNVLQTLQSHPSLDYIEADGTVTAYAKSKGI